MSGMQIERVGRSKNYSVIPNDVFDHKDMSWRATCILVYMLSRPDWWVISTDRLAALHTEGREAVRTALRELEAFGYVRRTRTRNEQGQWAHKMQVFDTPQPKPEPEVVPDQDVSELTEPEPDH